MGSLEDRLGKHSISRLSGHVRRYPATPLLLESQALLLWAGVLLAEGNATAASYVGSFAILSWIVALTFQVVRETWDEKIKRFAQRWKTDRYKR